MCYFVFSQVRFRGILDPTYLSAYLSTNLYKFDLKKVGWRGPPLPEWLGIEGKGCKILSRLSLSEGTQLEVSSAHSEHCCSELLCRLCSRVTDCLTLWGQAWLNLNGITAGRAWTASTANPPSAAVVRLQYMWLWQLGWKQIDIAHKDFPHQSNQGQEGFLVFAWEKIFSKIISFRRNG